MQENIIIGSINILFPIYTLRVSTAVLTTGTHSIIILCIVTRQCIFQRLVIGHAYIFILTCRNMYKGTPRYTKYVCILVHRPTSLLDGSTPTGQLPLPFSCSYLNFLLGSYFASSSDTLVTPCLTYTPHTLGIR